MVKTYEWIAGPRGQQQEAYAGEVYERLGKKRIPDVEVDHWMACAALMNGTPVAPPEEGVVAVQGEEWMALRVNGQWWQFAESRDELVKFWPVADRPENICMDEAPKTEDWL